MINKVNFTGKVFVTPYAQKTAKSGEIPKIKEYADKNDVDVFVYDRTGYTDELSSYSVIVAKEGKIQQKTLKANKGDEITLEEVPRYDVPAYLDGLIDLKSPVDEKIFRAII